MEVVMPGGLKKKTGTEFIGFRCPLPMLEWLKSKSSKEVTLTEVILWGLNFAKSYTTELKDLDARIAELAKANDMTELGVLKRAMERGVAQLEKELGPKKR